MHRNPLSLNPFPNIESQVAHFRARKAPDGRAASTPSHDMFGGSRRATPTLPARGLLLFLTLSPPKFSTSPAAVSPPRPGRAWSSRPARSHATRPDQRRRRPQRCSGHAVQLRPERRRPRRLTAIHGGHHGEAGQHEPADTGAQQLSGEPLRGTARAGGARGGGAGGGAGTARRTWRVESGGRGREGEGKGCTGEEEGGGRTRTKEVGGRGGGRKGTGRRFCWRRCSGSYVRVPYGTGSVDSRERLAKDVRGNARMRRRRPSKYAVMGWSCSL